MPSVREWGERARTQSSGRTRSSARTCADGNYARRYDSATKLGDLLDHVGGLAKGMGLAVALWYASGQSPGGYLMDKKVGILVAAVAGMMCIVSAGCLEKLYKANRPDAVHSKTLELTEPFCAISIGGAMGMGVANAIIIPGLVAAHAV
jgi:hypothetical protein